MFRRWLFAALFFAMPALAAPSLDDAADLAGFVDGEIAASMRAYKIPSAVVTVVKDGRVLFARGYGVQDLDTGVPVDPATSLFRIGSTSKLFTWTAVMQLVEQGKLDLDADVNRYLKGFQVPAAFGKPITLRALMTHTPGFEESGMGFLFTEDPAQQLSIQEALTRHRAARVRPPLTLPSYSNYGVAIAGLIVEQVAGVPFSEYVRRNVFEPLGMRRATFDEPLPAPLRAGAVTGYVREGGVFAPRKFEILGGLRPAGAASVAALDMAQFMIAHLQKGRLGEVRILGEATATRMQTRAFANDDRLPGMALGFYESNFNGLRVIGHAGSTAYFSTDLALVPDRQVGIFISYNVDNSAPHKQFFRAFFDRYFPGPIAPPPQADPGAPLSAYEGTYQRARRSFSTIEKFVTLTAQWSVDALPNGRLRLDGVGDEPMQLVPIGRDLFRQVDGDRVVAFRRDAAGTATHLFLDSAPFMPAERVPFYENAALWSVLLPLSLLTLVVAAVVLRRVWIVTATAVLAVGFFVAFVLAFAGAADRLEFEIPFSVRLALLVPLLFLPAAAATIVLAVRRRGWPLVAASCAALVIGVFLVQWRLVGWQFG